MQASDGLARTILHIPNSKLICRSEQDDHTCSMTFRILDDMVVTQFTSQILRQEGP